VKPVGGRVAAVTIGAVVCGILAATAFGSPPSAITVSNPVGKADLDRTVNLDADGIVFKTKAPTDLRVQTVAFAPLGRTGWHHHPGIVLVAVQSGTVTVYDSRCHSKAYGPGSPNGSVFVESGREPLEVRNLSSTDTATVVATLVAPNSDLDIFRAEDTVRCR
jgi:quercetin dioxygenase-like cupin family protein